MASSLFHGSSTGGSSTGQPQLGDQPVLQGGRHPLHPALGLWGHGEDLLDAQLPHHRRELGGLEKYGSPAGVVLEGRVAVAVQGQGDSPLPHQPFQQDQIAPRVFGMVEYRLGHSGGGVVHCEEQDELSARSPSQGWWLPSTWISVVIQGH